MNRNDNYNGKHIQIYHNTSYIGQFHTKRHVLINDFEIIKKWLRQWFNIFKHCIKIASPFSVVKYCYYQCGKSGKYQRNSWYNTKNQSTWIYLMSFHMINGKYNISLAQHVIRYVLYKWDIHTWCDQQSISSRLKHTLKNVKKLFMQKYGRIRYHISQV